MMEQQAKNDTAASKTSPSIRLKQHHSTTDTPGLDNNNQRVVTTSNSSKSLGVNVNILESSVNQQPTATGMMKYKFVLPSKEGCNLALEQNFEPPLADSKSLRAREVWHKALEKEHAAQIKKKSLLGHLLCSEVLPESDIFSYSRN